MERPEFVKYGRLDTLVELGDVRPHLKRELKVFEKVDGGNCQVRNIGGWDLAGGTKANYLDGRKARARPWFGKFFKWLHSNKTLYNLPSNVVLFGEWSGNHTITYSDENTDQFFVIDVKDLDTGKFLKYGEGRDLVELSGVRDVRFLEVLAEGKLEVELIDALLNEQSDLYGGHREGLVLKAYDDPQEIFRLHHPDFSEAFKALGGRVEYVTPSRIQKSLHKLFDEEAERITKEEIIDRVVRDVAEERGNVSHLYVRRKFEKYIEEEKLEGVKRFLDRES